MDHPREESEGLFQPGELRDYLHFALGAVGRHRWGFACLLLGFLSLAGAVAYLFPKSFRAHARVLALPAEDAPGAAKAGPGQPEVLAQAAAEVVFSRDHLEQLAGEERLRQAFAASRSPAHRLLDRLRDSLKGEPSQKERERAMRELLARRLFAESKNGVVTFAFEWPEPEGAREVVGSALQRFLASRRAAEVEPLSRKAEVLAAEVQQAQARVVRRLAEVQELRLQKRRGAKASTVRGVQADGRWNVLPEPELAQLRLRLVAKRRAIQSLEDSRQRRVAELGALLADQRATLAPTHPTVLDTEERLLAARRQSQEVEALQEEEGRLLAQFVQAGGKELELSPEPGPLWPPELDEPEEQAFRRARVEAELSQLNSALATAAEAKVRLAWAEAAFAHRYAVLEPPETASEPVSPGLASLLLLGLVGAVLLSWLSVLGLDLRGRRIRESWQVERGLGLPVLVQVDRA